MKISDVITQELESTSELNDVFVSPTAFRQFAQEMCAKVETFPFTHIKLFTSKGCSHLYIDPLHTTNYILVPVSSHKANDE
jgi:hypothetical protein